MQREREIDIEREERAREIERDISSEREDRERER